MLSNNKQLIDDKDDKDYNLASAGVAELADATDLKSVGAILVGSSPTLGTIKGVMCLG